MMTAGALVGALLSACTAGVVPAEPTLTPGTQPTHTQPSPTRAEDWQVIFDGDSTDALRGYGMAHFPGDAWAVEDGALRAVPGAGVDLITRHVYGDFELEFEWRVAEAGNSGVIYRVRESAEPSWASGPEYQILDDERHLDGGRPETSAGALYDLLPPAAGKVLQPVGEYNQGRVVLRDGHVEHWLNGVLLVQYEWNSAEMRELIEQSKFGDLAHFMRQPEGHIVFQHHGEEVWLRNLRIRPLPPAG